LLEANRARNEMLSRCSQRGTAPLLGACRRHLITQPVVLKQGEHTAPIFLDPPSPPDAEMAAKLRAKLQKLGVNVTDIDLAIFQKKQENYEFDTPALPTEDSPLYGYMWGNGLVKNQVLLETLSEEDDYLRGYLEKTTEELYRKMTIHYPKVNVKAKKAAMLKAMKSSSSLYTDAKVDALADFVKEDTDAYLNLYRNNSYISSYNDGDAYGYDIPTDMQAKIEGLAQFDWDSAGACTDPTPYVQMTSQLSDAVGSKMKAANPKLADSVRGYIKSCAGKSTAEVVALASTLQTASASLCGTVPEDTKDQVAVVSAAMKGMDAGAMVQAFRGASNASEAAAVKAGKANFADADEARLKALVQLANVATGVSDANVVPLLVSGLMSNCPSLFSQFAMNNDNVQKFAGVNASAFDAAASGVAALAPVSAELNKAMGSAMTGVAKFVKDNGVDATGVDMSGLVAMSGTASPSWMVNAAKRAAANSTGLDKVEALTMATMLSSSAAAPAMDMYNALFTPGGAEMKNACAGAEAGTLVENMGANLASLLAGRTTPAQAEMIAGKLGTVAEVKAFNTLAAKSNKAYAAVDEAFSGATWLVEESSIPELMHAYKSLPHPSFSNVNAY